MTFVLLRLCILLVSMLGQEEDNIVIYRNTGDITRVMSPTANEGLLLEVTAVCGRCNTGATELVICAQCGMYGHAQCLGMEYFQNYPFCGGCLPNVMLQYANYQTAVRREQWTRTVAARIGNWKQRAVEAIGMSTTVGVAVGGAAAAVTGT